MIWLYYICNRTGPVQNPNFCHSGLPACHAYRQAGGRLVQNLSCDPKQAEGFPTSGNDSDALRSLPQGYSLSTSSLSSFPRRRESILFSPFRMPAYRVLLCSVYIFSMNLITYVEKLTKTIYYTYNLLIFLTDKSFITTYGQED